MALRGTIRFRCPHCEREIVAPASAAGQASACPNDDCRVPVLVPFSEGNEPATGRSAEQAEPVPADKQSDAAGRAPALVEMGKQRQQSIRKGLVAWLRELANYIGFMASLLWYWVCFCWFPSQSPGGLSVFELCCVVAAWIFGHASLWAIIWVVRHRPSPQVRKERELTGFFILAALPVLFGVYCLARYYRFLLTSP